MWNLFYSHHNRLFDNNATIKLGKIHCTILIGRTAFEKKAIVQKDENEKEFVFTPIELTSFGKETARNFTKWWVRKHVEMLAEIDKKITEIMPYLDKLKRASLKLTENSSASNYEELINEICDFVEKNRKEVDVLYNFVIWLMGIDKLSPCVLFNHPPWSTTQLSERYFKIENCDNTKIQICTETVLGLRLRGMPTLATIRNDI